MPNQNRRWVTRITRLSAAISDAWNGIANPRNVGLAKITFAVIIVVLLIYFIVALQFDLVLFDF
jgi:uncharacterized membrane protein YtjA (UPF0391 family)